MKRLFSEAISEVPVEARGDMSDSHCPTSTKKRRLSSITTLPTSFGDKATILPIAEFDAKSDGMDELRNDASREHLFTESTSAYSTPDSESEVLAISFQHSTDPTSLSPLASHKPIVSTTDCAEAKHVLSLQNTVEYNEPSQSQNEDETSNGMGVEPKEEHKEMDASAVDGVLVTERRECHSFCLVEERKREAEKLKQSEAATIALTKQMEKENLQLLKRSHKEKNRLEKEQLERETKAADDELRKKQEESEMKKKNKELEAAKLQHESEKKKHLEAMAAMKCELEKHRRANEALMADKRKHLETARELENEKKRAAKRDAATEKMAENFDCDFCLDVMCPPASLPCGHGSCHQCLYNHLQSTADASSEVERKCHSCRETIADDCELVVNTRLKAVIRHFIDAHSDENVRDEYNEREREYKDWFTALKLQKQMDAEFRTEAQQLDERRVAMASVSAVPVPTDAAMRRAAANRELMQRVRERQPVRNAAAAAARPPAAAQRAQYPNRRCMHVSAAGTRCPKLGRWLIEVHRTTKARRNCRALYEGTSNYCDTHRARH